MNYEIVVIVLMVIFHEAGHYLYAVFRRLGNGIGITWWGIEVRRKVGMSIGDDLLMCLFGILFGLPFAFVLGGYWYFLYYVLSTVDIAKIIIDFDVGIKHGFRVNELDICRMVLKGKL